MSSADRLACAQRVLGLIDLTDLADDSTARHVRELCARAVGPQGAVAAVCVWPRHVAVAREALPDGYVRVATVANFPTGAESVDQVVAETEGALASGADEIDVVLPYRSFAAGDAATAAQLLDAVRSVVPRDGAHLLKVILETGELSDPRLIESASRLAIDHGADFIKTSTGKTPASASLEATEIMLTVIRMVDRRVGLKPSGGIRSLDDAAAYLAQADEMMGAGWVSPQTFRFGASGLLDAVVAELESSGTTAHSETHPTDSSPTETDY